MALRISASACSRVCPGSAYIRSRLKLSKFACAISTARRASPLVVDAPERMQMLRVEALDADGQPVDAQRAEVGELLRLERPRVGLQGDLGIRRQRQARANRGQDLVERMRGQQAGRAAAEEDAVHAPAPDQRQCLLEVGGQRRDVALLGKLAARFMRVEVAVRTLAHAPGDMDVQRQRRQCLERHLGRAQGRTGDQHGHDVANCTRCAAIRAIRAEPAAGR